MRETSAQMLITIFGGRELLSRSLGISSCAEDVQTSFLERFCECVFKRVVLRAPSEHIREVIDEFEHHRESGRALADLIVALGRYIPDMELHVKSELEKAIDEFHL